MVTDKMKKQMSDGNSTYPLDPMDKQNSNGHFQVHWIHWIQWTLSFGYLNGLVSTWCPYSCHYVIQIHINWPTEKENVRWKFHLSIGSNGQTKFQWTFPGPMDPLDPLDTFVWLSQRPTIYLHDVCHMLVITLFKDILIDQPIKQMSDGNSTCPLDPMDKQNSNGHFQVHWIHSIQWTLSFGYLNGLASVYMMSICLSLRHSNTY
jgi:hypothetical protein